MDDELDHKRAARLFAKVIGILLTELDRTGVAVVDPETDASFAIYCTDDNIVIEETSNVEEGTWSYLGLIKEGNVH